MSNGAELGLVPASGDGVTVEAPPAVTALLADAGVAKIEFAGSGVEEADGGTSEGCDAVGASVAAAVASVGAAVVVDGASAGPVGAPPMRVEGDGVSNGVAAAVVEFIAKGIGMDVETAAAPRPPVPSDVATSFATRVEAVLVAAAAGLPPSKLTMKPTTPPKAPIPASAVLVSVTMSRVEAAPGAVVVMFGIPIVDAVAAPIALPTAMVLVIGSAALGVAPVVPGAAAVALGAASVLATELKIPPKLPIPSPERSLG